MDFQHRFLGITAVLIMSAVIDVSRESSLHNILKKRDVAGASTVHANPQLNLALTPPKAKEFLAKLRRPKRNLWDRSRADVQQWIMQFTQMGFDEQRLETDLAFWKDHSHSSDQGRQHHHDENSPIGPRHPGSYRHGADVNYDYY